jgi:hypothetical protein
MKRNKELTDGAIFRRGGAWFRVEHMHDDCHGAPDKECDVHGVVTEWMERRGEQEARNVGLRELASDRGRAIYYDMAQSLRIAHRDNWGRGKSKSAKRRAVVRDYEYLRGWYSDEWHYIGVIVERLTGANKGEKASLWGLESFCTRYLSTVARELADELRPAKAPKQPRYEQAITGTNPRLTAELIDGLKRSQ